MFMKMYARPLTADATSAMLHFVQATRTKCTREHVVNVNAVSHHNARIFVDGVTLAVKDEEILHATSQCSMEGQLRHKTLTQIFERTNNLKLSTMLIDVIFCVTINRPQQVQCTIFLQIILKEKVNFNLFLMTFMTTNSLVF